MIYAVLQVLVILRSQHLVIAEKNELLLVSFNKHAFIDSNCVFLHYKQTFKELKQNIFKHICHIVTVNIIDILTK